MTQKKNIINHNSNMEAQINELIAKLQTGSVTHSQFLKKMNAISTPQQATQKKQQKTERAKKTRFMNKAKASHQNMKHIASKQIAEGNKLIQKMDMHYDMKAINQLHASVKAQSKKTLDKAGELIKKIEKLTPKQILELPEIKMNLGQAKRNLGIDSLGQYWENTYSKAETHNVSVTVNGIGWNIKLGEYVNFKLGPYEYKMPINLSWEDKYLFLLYVWVKNSDAYEFVTHLGGTIIFLKHVDIKDIRMAGTLFHNKLIDTINNEVKIITKVGECVQGYIWEAVKGQYGFNNYTKAKLFDEINYYVEDTKKRPCTRDILNWRDDNHKNVSIYGIDPRYKTFVSSPSTDKHNSIKLVFQVKNGHCYPIINDVVQTLISKKGNIKSCVDVMKWSDQSDSLYECKHESEVYDIIKNNTHNESVVILPDGVNLKTVLIDSILKTSILPEYFHYNSKNMLDGFLSQGLHTMFVANNEYNERKNICEQIYKIYPNDLFKFKNQGFTTIATQLFNCMFGYIPVSEYNEKVLQMIDSCSPTAMQDSFLVEDLEAHAYETYDIAKAYPSILINNKYDFPIYSIHDTLEEYKGEEFTVAEYFIDKNIIVDLKTVNGKPIIIPAGMFTRYAVEKLLYHELITKDDIKYVLKAKQSLKASAFKEFMQYLFKTYEESTAKKMANQFIGFLGTKYDKTNYGYMTSDIDDCLASWSEGVGENVKVSITKEETVDELYQVRYQDVTRKLAENCSINRAVVCDCNMLLLDMMYNMYGKKSRIVGYNTDSVCLTKPDKDDNIKDKVKKEDKIKGAKYPVGEIGKIYHDTESTIMEVEKTYNIPEMDYGNFKTKEGKGKITTGGAGCGKTTKLIELVKKCDDAIVLCFTNKACSVIREKLGDKKDIVHTFDSYLSSFKKDQICKLKNHTVFVDEYSMVPNQWMTTLYNAFVDYGITVNLFGDCNQCAPVDDFGYDYLKSPAILAMCPTIEKLEYIEASARYDKKTYEILSVFLKTGRITSAFNKIVECDTNICFFNNTRARINKDRANKFIVGLKTLVIEMRFKNPKVKELYNVCVGMPVICTANIKEMNMYNSEQYTIEKMDESTVTINKMQFTHDEFKQSFTLAFCITVYRYQGDKIDTHYNIYDADRMDKRQLYTAMSRTTKHEYVHVDKLSDQYWPKTKKDIIERNVKFTDHKNGKIYRIKFDNGEFYIGSTINTIEQRLGEHLKDPKSQVYARKQHNPTIELICTYPCYDKSKLEACEKHYITLEATEKLINKRMNDFERNQKQTEKNKRFECYIQSESDLITKMKQKYNIVDDVKDSRLRIVYKENGKTKNIKAKYNATNKDKVQAYMKGKQQELYDALTLKFDF